MGILITGATGLIGRELIHELAINGHEDIRVLSRAPKRAQASFNIPIKCFFWDPQKAQIDKAAFDSVHTIIHLAGENIGARRWSKKQKEKIINSRVLSTRLLVNTINENKTLPIKKFISASAIGIYGNRSGDQVLDEKADFGSDFLAKTCIAWEEETFNIQNKEIIVNHVRTGIVLARDGGALEKMLIPFKLGVAGKLGSGEQMMSWIHLSDMVSIYRFLVENDFSERVFNAVAPKAHSNSNFTRIMGKVLKRPTLLPAPGFALKIILGEMATLVLDGQNVYPKNLLEKGYKFKFDHLEDALTNLVGPEKEFKQVQWVEHPLDEVFDFFSDERNLETITPDSLSFKVLGKSTEQIEAGTIIDYKLSLYGLPFKWKTEISSFDRNKEFTDTQLKGPYKKWVHTHGFKKYANGTLMTDNVSYKVPMGEIGSIFAGAFVRKDINKIFNYRSQKLYKIFGETDNHVE
ncbi:TIGR01777 family oxidoreductase [Halobacteriovorax sp. ZH4_bin.1]|uniref:TIGR01777 family oxidoreductase n=1 Tax=unclassified Halobacteriovorax TaxID=2639665 RepID=UPI003713292B